MTAVNARAEIKEWQKTNVLKVLVCNLRKYVGEERDAQRKDSPYTVPNGLRLARGGSNVPSKVSQNDVDRTLDQLQSSRSIRLALTLDQSLFILRPK